MLAKLRRWSHATPFAYVPEQITILDGLRGAAIVAALVLLTEVRHMPILAWGAFAAFWTCLADTDGRNEARLGAMSAFVLLGSLIVWIALRATGFTFFGQIGALYVVVGLCSLAALFGPALGQVGLLGSVVAVVAIDQPAFRPNAFEIASIFFASGTLAAVVTAYVRPGATFRPVRRAVSGIYRDLGSMITEFHGHLSDGSKESSKLPIASARFAVRRSIERARSTLKPFENGKSTDIELIRLRRAIDAADQIFAGLIALEHAAEVRPQRAKRELGEVLDHLGHTIKCLNGQVSREKPDWAEVAARSEIMSERVLSDPGLVRVTACWRDALQFVTEPDATPAFCANSAPIPAKAIARSSPQLAWPAIRHALRIAFVVVCAFALSYALSIPYAYWGMMAVVVVMQSVPAPTWPRFLERCAGSIAGGVAAAFLSIVCSTPTAIAAWTFPLAAATLALRRVNYTLFVFFLTPLFVLVADLIAPGHGAHIAFDRVANNVIGSLLAFVGTLLLWPEAQKLGFANKLAEAVEANVSYTVIALESGGAWRPVETARRRAGIASNAAEEALFRLRFEGRHDRQMLSAAADLLKIVRRLAGATTAYCLLGPPDEKAVANRAAEYEAVAKNLGLIMKGREMGGREPKFEFAPASPMDAIVKEIWDRGRGFAQTLHVIRTSVSLSI